MALKKQRRKQPHKRRHFAAAELRTISYIATLILASVVVLNGIDSSAAWGFLGVAIGVLFGRATNSAQA